ncbi:hypothetical protein VTK73DRAFT_6274 [Phialemonium thermophilum]|uniref:Uncharacterized protein n=1 Tax=Phialemonium thermophilum TaxID=223376 RepID=A0ABR3V1G6_9PEZI
MLCSINRKFKLSLSLCARGTGNPAEPSSDDKDHGTDDRHERPPARALEQEPHAGAGVGVLGAAARGGAVRQGAVDEDGAGAVDVADVDEALVERGVVAVADQLVQDGAVAGVVAAALDGGVAGAGDGLGLVAVRALVVEAGRPPPRPGRRA